ncbi:hypothetical protein MNBD_NITROSPINAE02-1469 [hydrothermal vent metagenome]|uniref:Uncharacterized protein n=1 Tax=hydrothermal vent metagenome TaxID=652676 RepID=A0A3B1CAI1_9ZZZZ
MNGWIVFQLLVDVALFAIIVLYIMRSGQQHKIEMEDLLNRRNDPAPQVEPDQMEKLLDELARLVVRAEKVAVRIEKGAGGATTSEDAKNNQAGGGKIDAGKKREHSKPAAKTSSTNQSNEKQYGKAAKLIKKGMTDEDIGRIVGLPEHEIGLIRRMDI